MSGSVWDRALKYKGRQDGSVSEGTCQVWQDCFHAQNAHSGRRSDYCKFSLDLHIHIKMCMRLCVGMQACTHTRRKKGSKLAALAVIIIVTLSTVIITFLHLRLCFLEQRFSKSAPRAFWSLCHPVGIPPGSFILKATYLWMAGIPCIEFKRGYCSMLSYTKYRHKLKTLFVSC